MSLFLSILLVLSTWLLFQQWFRWQRTHRRKKLARVSGTVREVVDSLPLVVTASHRFQGFPPNTPTHSTGRLVLTEQWMALACDKGLLMKIESAMEFRVRRLGEQRLVLIGPSTNPAIQLRIVLTFTREESWVQHLLAFSS